MLPALAAWQGRGGVVAALIASVPRDHGHQAVIVLPRIAPEVGIQLGKASAGVVTLSFSDRKGQWLVDIHAKQAAIFHASKASRRW